MLRLVIVGPSVRTTPLPAVSTLANFNAKGPYFTRHDERGDPKPRADRARQDRHARALLRELQPRRS